VWPGVIVRAQATPVADERAPHLVFLPVILGGASAGAQVEPEELESEKWEDEAWGVEVWGDEAWETMRDEPSATREGIMQLASGNVSVRVSKGNLLVKGDNRPNCLVLVPGSGLTQGTVNPCDNTTINGRSDPFVFDTVDKDYKIHLQGGADTLTIDGTVDDPGDLPASLKLHTGAGDDKITLLEVHIFDKTEIRTGSGADTVELDQPGVSSVFENKFDVETGSGNDAVDLCSGIALVGTKTVFNDGVQVKLGAGVDRLCVCGAFARGAVKFDGGSGSNDGYVVEEVDFQPAEQRKNFENFPDDCTYLGGKDCNPPPPVGN
jgi:hypothetical protein